MPEYRVILEHEGHKLTILDTEQPDAEEAVRYALAMWEIEDWLGLEVAESLGITVYRKS